MRSKEFNAVPTVQECVWVATLRKPVGIKGRVAFVWRDPFFFDNVQIEEGCFLFVERDGLLVPYELQDIEERGDGRSTVALTLVATVDEARALQGMRVFVPKWMVLDRPSDSLLNEDLEARLLGHYVEDEIGHYVGRVSHVYQYPMNVVLGVVREECGEVLLPLSEELLIEMPQHMEPSEDFPLKLRIPEGLL